MRALAHAVTLTLGIAAIGCGGSPSSQEVAGTSAAAPVKERAPELPPIVGPPDVALRRAALEGQAAIVQSALAKGADINAPNADGVTALMLAASKGHPDVADLLLSNGARVDAVTKEDKETPLMMAANWGHTAIVDLLIEKGANINLEDGGKRNVLDWAGMDNSVTPEDSKALQRHLKEKGVKAKPQDTLGLFVSVGSMPKVGELITRAAEEK